MLDPEVGLVGLSDSESSSSLEDIRLVPVEDKEHWDCESILSTYSNLYNHPKLISEPKVRVKFDYIHKLNIIPQSYFEVTSPKK